MKKIFVLLTIVSAAFACSDKTARQSVSLKFNDDGSFKIVQFTDMHLCWDRKDCFENTMAQMAAMLDAETPNLAVFTGDIVTGSKSDSTWSNLFKPLFERNIPFIVTYGNHDREQDNPTMDIADIIMSFPNNLNTAFSGTLDDCALEIFSHDGSKVAALVYAMDSNDYSTTHTMDDYGWFTPEQVQWYRSTSQRYTKANAGVPVPALAFFHIALLEHNQAYNHHHTAGIRGENECPGEMNSGMFANMMECGDVMGIFVGHDHDNDYTALKDDIMLGFGRFSGSYLPVGKTTYINWPSGARIFELEEGRHSFKTWKRLYDADGIFDFEEFHKAQDYTIHKACKCPGKTAGLNMSVNGNDSETVASPDIWEGEGRKKFVFDGYLDVPESGLWTLFADGRGKICWSVDDVKIVGPDNGLSWWSTVNLEKGLHPVHIEYLSEDSQRLLLRWHDIYDARFLPIPESNWFVE